VEVLRLPQGSLPSRRVLDGLRNAVETSYGRGYGKNRLYFLRIAIGSARESKGWYYRAKELLSPDDMEHRLNLIGEVIALLVTELNKSANRANQQIGKSSK
jgi:hypothetical protein